MLSAFGQYACGVFFDYLIKGIGQQFYKKTKQGWRWGYGISRDIGEIAIEISKG